MIPQNLFSHIPGDDFDVVIGEDFYRLKIPLTVSVISGRVHDSAARFFNDFEADFTVLGLRSDFVAFICQHPAGLIRLGNDNGKMNLKNRKIA